MDNPTIRLAGKDWEIPVLAIRQNRIAAPAIMELLPVFARIGTARASADTDPLWFSKLRLSTAEYDLLCDAIFAALGRAYPTMTRSEFDTMPAQLEELLAAFPIVAQQTGIFKPAPTGAPPQGEAPAGTESPSISTSSALIMPSVAGNDGTTN
jgi:hypothetical protein